MKQYIPGQIVLLDLPFTDLSGNKRRPALVLLDTGDDDIVAARVTSQISQTNFDAAITAWQQAGLLMPSLVRVNKLSTLEKKLIIRDIGELNHHDWDQVREKLKHLWSYLSEE